MDRIFINTYVFDNDWIVGKIANDIKLEAERLGYACRCGKTEEYDNEEICYHMSYHLASPIPQAKHNSVFVTHIDDPCKEKVLCDLNGLFDSYICMSQEDAQYLIELGFDRNKVFGKTLPVRNTYLRPISIGIFSACYPDGRKNEQWLIDYCRQNSDSKLVNFVFIGKGWNRVCDDLESLDCSYEWHNASRKMPYEYQFQQNKLSSLDYYIYMGMDGGAMGSYDAYAQDVPLCVTYDGFHKSIPNIDYPFDDKQSFFNQLDKIIQSHKQRITFYNDNSVSRYTEWILKVWKGDIIQEIDEKEKYCISYHTVVEKRRKNFFDVTKARLKDYFLWKSLRIKNTKK
jgi:hypothetical protein